MRTLHIVASLLVVAALGMLAYNAASGKVIEGLESGTNGTVADQLQKSTKALDGGAEMFMNMAHIDKNKSDVATQVKSYKTWLQHAITMGVQGAADGSAKSMEYLTSGKSDVTTLLKDMAIFKQQLDYVAIAEQVLGGQMPVLPKSKGGGWL